MENSYLLDTHVIMQAFNSGLELPEAFYCVAAITQDELLSNANISESEKVAIVGIFKQVHTLEASNSIIQNAKLLQNKYTLTAADAIISATAYTYNLSLISNDSVFKQIEEIKLEPFYFVQ